MEIFRWSHCQRCGASSPGLHSYRTLHRISSLLPAQFCHTVFFILILLLHEGLPAQVATFVPTDIKKFDNDSSSTDGYYRYLQVDADNGLLYVGAMEYMYRLHLSDISTVKDSVYLPPDPGSVNSCIGEGKSKEFQCKNHVRSIALRGDTIAVCGTGSYDPREDVLYTDDLKFTGTVNDGQSKCPFEPSDNATSIYVENGNPGNVGALYSGTYRDAVHRDPVIYRPPIESFSELLRNERDKKMLDNPDFVNSFDVGGYVYFFFRESAQEAMNCGKAVYSRIARICKNDLGGEDLLEYKWTTYLKARLNCSISGEFPFYFHELYDVKQIGDIFYGTFSTNNADGLYGSAVCGFSKEDIEAVFDEGDFKEQADPTSLWLAVDSERVPTQRPGKCVNNSRDLPSEVEIFIKDRPLMDAAVAHINTDAGVPLYHQSGHLFNNMAVDTVTIDDTTYNVFYLTTDQGQIHKVVQWTEGGHARSRLVSVWKPFGDRVTSIKTVKHYNQMLYIGTDSAVIQLSVMQCQSYTYCSSCVQDPHCGWHNTDKMCTTYDAINTLNSVKEDNPIMQCNSACKKQDQYENSVRIPGDPIYLHCDSHCPSDSVLWYHDGSSLTIDNVKYFLTQDQGIIIFNITVSDGGQYSCTDSSSDVELAKHVIIMPSCGDDTSCLWREEFRNWCSEFDSYKKQFNNWVCLKDACLDSETCMPSGISDACPVSP